MSNEGDQFVADIVDGLESVRQHLRGERVLRVTTLTEEDRAAYLATLNSAKGRKSRTVKRVRRRRS